MNEENLILAVCDRIRVDRERIKKNELPRIKVESFDLSNFWAQFGTSVQALSNEVTKINFMCGKKPYPKAVEVDSMLQDMVKCYNVMRECYQVLPQDVGETLFAAVTTAVEAIMSSLLDVVNSLKDISEKGAKERLILTGTFWDACKAVDSLPRNNLLATINVFKDETDIVTDAFDELTNALHEDQKMLNEPGDVEDADKWTNSERDLVRTARGFVKVIQQCLQNLIRALRQSGSSATIEECSQLDQITKLVHNISPALDDFVSELYHPVDFTKVFENAEKLVEVLQSLLSFIPGCHFEQGISIATVVKLKAFIIHYHSRLDPNNSNPAPELASLTVNS